MRPANISQNFTRASLPRALPHPSARSLCEPVREMAASGEKAELMGLLAERMQGIAEQAAAVAERTQRASQLAVRARECAELYGGM